MYHKKSQCETVCIAYFMFKNKFVALFGLFGYVVPSFL